MPERQRDNRMAALMGAAPYVIGGVALVLYFIWLCLSMASFAQGGTGLFAGIFGGVVLGIIAGGFSFLGHPGHGS